MNGAFSDKWLDVATSNGLIADKVQVEWGQPIPPEAVDAKLKLGGFDKGLLLMVGSHYFEQATGKSLTPGVEFPYDTLPHELTTWGEWKQSHAETEIYVGDLPADDIRRP